MWLDASVNIYKISYLTINVHFEKMYLIKVLVVILKVLGIILITEYSHFNFGILAQKIQHSGAVQSDQQKLYIGTSCHRNILLLAKVFFHYSISNIFIKRDNLLTS